MDYLQHSTMKILVNSTLKILVMIDTRQEACRPDSSAIYN